MSTALDLLRIFISWPFMVFVLLCAFGYTFRSEIRQLLGNVVSIKLPGGAEILTLQPPPATSETKEKEASPEPGPSVLTLTADQQVVIRAHIEDLTKQISTVAEEKEAILKRAVELISEKQREVRYWWFMFLSLFLVPTTKNVLRWFAAQTIPPTKVYYDEVWKVIVLDAKQREVILMVLLHYSLVEFEGQTLEVSQIGRDFLAFLVASEIPKKGV